MSDIIERAALVIADRMTDEDFAARGTDGAVFSEHDTRHLAEALADAGIIPTEVEWAWRDPDDGTVVQPREYRRPPRGLTEVRRYVTEWEVVTDE